MRQLTSNENVLKLIEKTLDAIESDLTEDYSSATKFGDATLTDADKAEAERVMKAYTDLYRTAVQS